MIKLLSLFSGIGAPEKALTNLGIDYDLVGYSEIDKYASKAYSLIHGVPEAKNLGDITKVDPDALPEDIDLITYGFPCQDISLAGKQRGFTDENGKRTRSGLFFEALRIIQETRPKVAIAENVKALTGKKFSAEFKIVLDSLNDAGYNNYWKVLNAKDYGVPQNRERVFIISIRKDIDQGYFVYPNKVPLTIKLRDVLEHNVDEKYYLRDEQIQSIRDSGFNQKRTQIQNDICGTLLARDYKDPKCVAETTQTDGIKCLGNIYGKDITSQAGRVYDPDGLCATITTSTGGNRQPIILEKEVSNAIRVGGRGSIDRHSWDLVAEPVIAASRGRYTESGETEQKLEPNMTGVSNTLTTVQKDNLVIEPNICHHPLSKQREFNGFNTSVSPCLLATDHKAPKCTMTQDMRIRKLTPKECWRLMGFDDTDIDKCSSAGISNTQLYKQAGNSIVVNVLENLFKNILTILDR